MRYSQIITKAKRLYCRNKNGLCNRLNCTHSNPPQAYEGKFLCQGCGIGMYTVLPGMRLRHWDVPFEPPPTKKAQREFWQRHLAEQKAERQREVQAAVTEAAAVAASRIPPVQPLNVKKKSSKSNAQRAKAQAQRSSKQVTVAQAKELRARVKAEKMAAIERSKMKPLPETPMQRWEASANMIRMEEHERQRRAQFAAETRRVKSFY